MKKTFLFVTMLYFSGISLFAQEYVPMLDAFNEWKLTSCNFGCLTDTYFTDGDTLVDGTSYKILDGYHYISRGFLLHEDVENRKVFIKLILPTGVEDYLLYDFSLKVGDLFEMNNPITPFPQQGGEFRLDSIVSRELVDANLYRHFYFSPAPGNTTSTENAIWIEGLGSLSIVNAPGGAPDINGVGHVSCFFKNGVKMYENLDSITECTPDILSVFDIKNDLTNVKAFFSNESLALFNAASIKEVSIYNLAGQCLLQKKVFNENRLTIDGSHWSSGVYFVRMLGEDQMVKAIKFLVD